MSKRQCVQTVLLTVCLFVLSAAPSWAQYAGLSGVIRDAQTEIVPTATVKLVDEATGLVRATAVNAQGVYVFSAVRPATYRLEINASGFALAVLAGLQLHVDERIIQDVTLAVESRVEAVEVRATRPMLGTLDGSVGTVLDQQFVRDLPVRGRSFSSLVGLVPGVTRLLPGQMNSESGSEFRVNGQRDTSNTLTVDGVSGQTEADASLGNAAGQRFASTQLGTVNGGVTMDAVQEIRVQTSTFAAEFGRSPGAQISLVTKSGTNRLSGSAFEQWRDDALTANDWFANSKGAAKPQSTEHQFGMAAGGPVVPNRLFFFGAYEGVRLERPRFVNQSVPSMEARQRVSPIRDLLQAFPEPTGPTRPDLTAELAQFYAQRQSSNSWSARADVELAAGIRAFGRYAANPSDRDDDNPFAFTINKSAKTFTGGLTASLGARALVDVRGNYGQATYETSIEQPSSFRTWFPMEATPNRAFNVAIDGATLFFDTPRGRQNRQRQMNLVGSISYAVHTHQFKAGVDYRGLRARGFDGANIGIRLGSLAQALEATAVPEISVSRSLPTHARFNNYSVYVQDTWRVATPLSVTAGVRWDINPPPTFGQGQGPLAATVIQPVQEARLASQQNMPLWRTNRGNIFPRLGVSYAMGAQGRTVLTGGVGIFGDLEGPATAASLSVLATSLTRTNVPLPLTPADVRGIDSIALNPPFPSQVVAVDPNLSTPRTTQWSLGLEQAIGGRQAVSATYVGARASNLLQRHVYLGNASPDFPGGFVTAEAIGSSRYQSFQLQHRARLVSGTQVLTSYTLGRARDTTSTIGAFEGVVGLATADADVRHIMNVALTWQGPTSRQSSLGWLLNNWSLQVIGTARSGLPVTIFAGRIGFSPAGDFFSARASSVPGVPTIVEDGTAPGGQRFNRAAFAVPPTGMHGDTGRNAYRGLAVYQVDLGVQRVIPIGRGAHVRFRVDAFNLLNTPVFAQPSTSLSSSTFGLSTEMAASGVAALYSVGGPRSVALSMRIEF